MKTTIKSLTHSINYLHNSDKSYKALRKHLNTMPVGFPATITGVERRILKDMFSVDEARVAVYMDWRFETADTIFEKAGGPLGMEREKVGSLLESMEKKGAIFAKNGDGIWKYALHPLILGMFEMHLDALTPGLWLDMRKYVVPYFLIEYMTSAIPQMRVIPVEKSVTPEHNIAAYDEIRHIIKHTEQEICIAECICRKASNLVGKSCERTDRKETCMGLGDFGAQYARNGWARVITREEALEHIDLCEKEGLIIHPFNEKNPEAICFCCGCCCGIVELLKSFPHPADFVASNYYAALDTKLCNGCGTCVKRCQTDAFTLKNKKKGKMAVLNTGKCIGCGLCVTTCKAGALKLVKKDTETVPPNTMEEKFQIIMDGKKGAVGKLFSTAKGIVGLKP
ncbi:MAG: 4Fe-4S binding protein [Proteobacteria bacterium]|nr:4Fe-4S binding protein [Pseudomonadota bacterium]